METRTALKGYFETGDKPTQTQFAALIDSVPNLVDDSSEYTEIILKTDVVVGIAPQDITILAVDSSMYFLITECWILILEKIGSSSDETKVLNVGANSTFILSLDDSRDMTPEAPEDLSSALQIHCDELPSGITSMKLRVLCRGYKVSKT